MGPGPYYGFSATVKDANGKVLGNWPCQKPPWGKLIAVNANTGDIAWETPSPALPKACRRTSRRPVTAAAPVPSPRRAAWCSTASTSDSRFRAFDSKTGKELWVTKMARSGSADPMTYEANGKQYVAIVIGDAVNVYTLP